MGQYYKPIILGKNKRTVTKWIYSHDYDNGLKLMEHSWLKNTFVLAFESLIANYPQHVIWAGDYAEKDKKLKSNCYHRAHDKTKVTPSDKKSKGNYIVNHTLKVFVDKRKVKDNNGWKIHPLPLLTCEGNGNGGGDFFGKDSKKLVGSWARDLISVEVTKPKGFKELIFNLIEN